MPYTLFYFNFYIHFMYQPQFPLSRLSHFTPLQCWRPKHPEVTPNPKTNKQTKTEQNTTSVTSMVSTSHLLLATFTLEKVFDPPPLYFTSPSVLYSLWFHSFLLKIDFIRSIKMSSSFLNAGQLRHIHYNFYWRACAMA